MALTLEGGFRLRQSETGMRGAGPVRPAVSVITVAYNSVGPLRETLDSVKAQHWDGIEHIVIDGGSADGTVDLLRARDAEIAFWRSASDAGIYDAMNRGLAIAIGQHVLFLNAGDILEGKVLFPGRDLERLLPVQAIDFWGRPRLLRLRNVRSGMPYCHQGILFRNESLVPFDTSLRIAADYEFLLANLHLAGMKPPQEPADGCVVFDTTGVSNVQILARDMEAARVILRRYGPFHWLRFWSRQAPKLVLRRLLAGRRRVHPR